MKISKPPFDYERLERGLLAFMPCRHVRAAIGQRTLPNGHEYSRLQCQDCGCPLSKRLARARVNQLQTEGIPVALWNETEALRCRLERWKYSEPICQAINLDRRRAWWESYSTYLKSDEWRVLADRIILRAAGVCEKCRRHSATHVHHLSYERAGEEQEHDLQALCFDCHDKAHDGMLTINRMLDELDREFGVGEHATDAGKGGSATA